MNLLYLAGIGYAVTFALVCASLYRISKNRPTTNSDHTHYWNMYNSLHELAPEHGLALEDEQHAPVQRSDSARDPFFPWSVEPESVADAVSFSLQLAVMQQSLHRANSPVVRTKSEQLAAVRA